MVGGVGLFGPAPFSREFGFLANSENTLLPAAGGFRRICAIGGK